MLSYSLVVAKGYVRLVRTGSRPSRPVMPSSFVRRNGLWVEREPDPADVDLLDLVDDDAWADEPDPLDPDVENELYRRLHPGRGDGGMSGRSRMNMRRLFVSLP